ncbi:LPXTG cell wall anchor domain-containing protein [Mycetocola sp. 2940]|uniref:LPXTG cell wall anchor domain-containing protein n=1 Tax=Mycetocola sp. 2940 TaxID=3156452 RepID=UPI0033950618
MHSTADASLVPCTVLATTGGSISPVLILSAVALVVLGLLFLLLGRRRRGGSKRGRHGTGAAGALIVIAFLGIGTVAAPPAQAATSQCAANPATGMSVAVEQTSTMVGMAPGIAPVAIEGIVTNTGGVALHIESVTVRIVDVSKAASAVEGSCDATDYVLPAPDMPVDRGLTSGQATTFAGASIGFSNKSVNQDACKEATVHLAYDVTVR